MTVPAPAGDLDESAAPALEWSRTWRPGWPVDVAATLSVHRRGQYDPAYRTVGADVWWAFRWRDVPVTTRFATRPGAGEIDVTVWTYGRPDVADAVVDEVPMYLGADDDLTGFRPRHPLVKQALRRLAGLRLGRTGRVFDTLVPTVLEQKVTSTEAHRGWARLLRRFGVPAPGPTPDPRVGPLVAPPSAGQWRRIPSWEWHRAGVGPQRSRTIVRVAAVADQLDRAGTVSSDVADSRLRSLPGVGVWSSAEVRQRSHGDPDAVSVGDANVPHHLAWVLAGERRATDERLLELLEPWPGHRHRVCDLLIRTTAGPPRRASRAPIRDYRGM